MIGLLALSAYVLLWLVLIVFHSPIQDIAIPFVLVAYVLVLGATLFRFSAKTDERAVKALAAALGGLYLLGAAGFLVSAIARLVAGRQIDAIIYGLLAILPCLYLVRIPRILDYRFVLILATFVVAYQMQKPHLKPNIDVWFVQQEACSFLFQGKNPYEQHYINVYGHSGLYGKGNLVYHESDQQLFAAGTIGYLGTPFGQGPLVTATTLYHGRGMRVKSFVYPPLSLLMSVPGYALDEDVRWNVLASVMGTIIFLVLIGRRLGLPPGHPAELAALALLYHPRIFFFLNNSWTEPFLALFMCMFVWAAASRISWLKPIVTAGILSAKQYGVLLIPALLASKQLKWRELIIGGLLALLIALPFLVLDWRMFWFGTVTHHMNQPLRLDSLSAPAIAWRFYGWRLPTYLGFIAATIVVGLVYWRRRPGFAYGAIGGAAIFMGFLLFNKSAFYNYYWLASVVLLLAVICSWAKATEPPADPQMT